MKDTSARPAGEFENVVHTYGSLLYRTCLVMLGNESDAEDAVQETFVKYLQKVPPFDGPEHEKAWLLTVAANQCRDLLRFRKRHPQTEAERLPEIPAPAADSGILEALMTLPEKFRLVLILYYVEEYPVDEIAGIIGKTPSAVKMRLWKGRRLLKEIYREEYL